MVERHTVDVAVIGAGIVGLGIAWQIARSGRSVAVIDPAPATGATYAAAGMLAPISELHHGEEDLLKLTLASAALYPAFAANLGAGIGYRTTGTLNVAADAADRRCLEDLRRLQEANGQGVQPLSIRSAREREPLLGPSICAVFSARDDHQVDPRLLASRLRTALESGGTVTIRQSATRVLHEDPLDPGTPATGVALSDGSVVRAAEVIVANGLGAADLAGLPCGLPLRAVHGDILRLRVPENLRPLLTATVRGLVRGLPVYIVPREDGTVVIGATCREDGRPGVSAGGVHQLLRDAQVLVPAVAELELIEVTARARPGTPDNAPLIGRVGPGLVIATGFFRHGVLLTPIAAQICLELLDGSTDPRWKRFHPDRFAVSPSKEASRA